jgi:hypothetical protein
MSISDAPESSYGNGGQDQPVTDESVGVGAERLLRGEKDRAEEGGDEGRFHGTSFRTI